MNYGANHANFFETEGDKPKGDADGDAAMGGADGEDADMKDIMKLYDRETLEAENAPTGASTLLRNGGNTTAYGEERKTVTRKSQVCYALSAQCLDRCGAALRVLSKEYDNFADVWARVVQSAAVSLPGVYFPSLYLFLNLYPRQMCGAGPLALHLAGDLDKLPRGVSIVQKVLEPKINASRASTNAAEQKDGGAKAGAGTNGVSSSDSKNKKVVSAYDYAKHNMAINWVVGVDDGELPGFVKDGL